jgi:hypothetical protein
MSYCTSSVPSNITADSLSSPLMSDSSAFLQIMSLSGFARANNGQKGMTYDLRPKMMLKIAWTPLGFHLLGALPKGRAVNAEYHRANAGGQ